MNKNRFTAAYILFGKISNGIQAIFILAENGLHYEAMELVRSNREAMDLIFYFLLGDDTSRDLKKWFDGEVIKNEIARNAFSKFLSDELQKAGTTLPVNSMKSGIYSGLSGYSHVTYAALLDSIDVYHQDFDFERIAGYHYTKASSLPYVQGEIEGMIVSLKHFYQIVGDNSAYEQLDDILRKWAPERYNTEKTKNDLEELKKRFNES